MLCQCRLRVGQRTERVSQSAVQCVSCILVKVCSDGVYRQLCVQSAVISHIRRTMEQDVHYLIIS